MLKIKECEGGGDGYSDYYTSLRGAGVSGSAAFAEKKARQRSALRLFASSFESDRPLPPELSAHVLRFLQIRERTSLWRWCTGVDLQQDQQIWTPLRPFHDGDLDAEARQNERRRISNGPPAPPMKRRRCGHGSGS